jgi:phosphoglycerate dehydrogenase-like enzyme
LQVSSDAAVYTKQGWPGVQCICATPGPRNDLQKERRAERVIHFRSSPAIRRLLRNSALRPSPWRSLTHYSRRQFLLAYRPEFNNYEVMTGPCAIVALSDAEVADFLPGDLWKELEELLPGHRRVKPPLPRAEDWPRLWKETPGEILVSAWQTPSLNTSVPAADLGSLRYVCHLAGTVRKLVPRELIAGGLLVTNWGDSISATVAECTLMLILMALRRAGYWSVAMHRDGAWKNAQTVTQSLIDRTVGLHGLGVIAQGLVPMLRPFTNRIQAYSPRVPDAVFAALGVKRATSLEALFASSEVVVELAAATAQNLHIVNEKLLRLIPERGVFVNVGRGCVVDEAALLRVAREGRIQVALDVYEQEPLAPDSPFRGLPNVTLLPHLGGPTRDRRRDCGALAVKNLRAFLRGEALDAVVTLEVYDRST